MLRICFRNRWFRGGLLFFIVLLSLFGGVVYADNVVQSFTTKTTFPDGTIVSIDSTTNVIKTPGGRADLIFGVVVDKTTAPILLDKVGGLTYVSSQGEYPVLVSNENGEIAVGDYISISSSADGVGAKPTGNNSLVLGKATTAFDGHTGVIGTVGKYNLGKIKVNIGIMKNPNYKNTLAIPGPLQKIGNSIAGHETSPLKIYIALVLFMVGTVLTLVLLVVGIRGGLMAIGRNPLSKHSIIKALAEVIIAGLVIFLTSLFGVYLLLRI